MAAKIDYSCAGCQNGKCQLHIKKHTAKVRRAYLRAVEAEEAAKAKDIKVKQAAEEEPEQVAVSEHRLPKRAPVLRIAQCHPAKGGKRR